MGSVLHEVDNDAVLILYLAGELPAEDRAEVEQLLTTDGGLRAALASARADAAAVGAALAAVDRADPSAGASASAEAIAVRQVGRAVRQWQVRQVVRRRPSPAPEPQPRLPAWALQAAVAAAVLLATVGYWRWESGRPGHEPALQDAADDGDAEAQQLTDAIGLSGGVDSELTDAERQANVLGRSADPSNVPTIVRDGSGD